MGYVCLDPQTPTPKQSRYKEQVAEMRKGRNSGLQKEQKEKHMVRHTSSSIYRLCFILATSFHLYKYSDMFGLQEHRQTFGNTREPLLENITSDYDLELFRKAQARASEDLVMSCLSSL